MDEPIKKTFRQNEAITELTAGRAVVYHNQMIEPPADSSSMTVRAARRWLRQNADIRIGRKPNQEPRERMSFSLPPATCQRIREIASAADVSYSDVARYLFDHRLRNDAGGWVSVDSIVESIHRDQEVNRG